MINFDNVTKQYPDGTVAVDNLTLEVPDGRLAVFVGPSGCGKTASMRMINRMIDPTSGTLTVNGEMSPRSTRSRCAWASATSSSAGLMPHQRVIDNVATVPVLKGQSRGRHGRPPWACSSGSGWTRNWPTATRATVGWPAAACRRGPGAGRRPRSC